MDDDGYEAFEDGTDRLHHRQDHGGQIQAQGRRPASRSTARFIPCTLEFKIVGIYSGTPDDRNMLFRQDYLDEASGDHRPGRHVVAQGEIRRGHAARHRGHQQGLRQHLRRGARRNASAPSSSASFRCGATSSCSSTLICSVVVFTLLLVTRQHDEHGHPRTVPRTGRSSRRIGFRRRELFAFILAESFGLAVAGALLGVGGAYCALHLRRHREDDARHFRHRSKSRRRSSASARSWRRCWASLPASCRPLAVARMSVVDGLKTLD